MCIRYFHTIHTIPLFDFKRRLKGGDGWQDQSASHVDGPWVVLQKFHDIFSVTK
jgi:hypothetical protein